MNYWKYNYLIVVFVVLTTYVLSISMRFSSKSCIYDDVFKLIFIIQKHMKIPIKKIYLNKYINHLIIYLNNYGCGAWGGNIFPIGFHCFVIVALRVFIAVAIWWFPRLMCEALPPTVWAPWAPQGPLSGRGTRDWKRNFIVFCIRAQIIFPQICCQSIGVLT